MLKMYETKTAVRGAIATAEQAVRPRKQTCRMQVDAEYAEERLHGPMPAPRVAPTIPIQEQDPMAIRNYNEQLNLQSMVGP